MDDWSGTALLPSLYEALKLKSRHHTFLFIAFAGEEDGLIGSTSIHSITQETLPILHSSQHKESAILFGDSYESFKLLPLYLAVLDDMPAGKA
ncbi:MAG TPA: hypothetical protein VHC72_03265 [Bryobacteraceae bacterium]|nr:hypothetical protein [Bryobacteraceae bacterium]